MGLRLFRRSSDPDIVVGRHSRPRVGPTVPGAAATLVAAAASWDHEPSRDAAPSHSHDERHEDSDSHDGQAPAVATSPEVAQAEVEATAAARHSNPISESALVPAGVSLGFADGAQIDLPADDPRVRTFHATAAALLEVPHA